MTPGTMTETEKAARDAAIDVDVLRRRVDTVLNDKLYWFPVRHHSPTVARFVDAVIRRRRPRLIFLEAPSEAAGLIPHLVDPKTRPPVAIYSSYRDDDNVLRLAGVVTSAAHVPARFAAWFPLLAYSPELVTLRAARKVGAEVVFMDLPHSALLRPPVLGQAPEKTPESDVEKAMKESNFFRRLTKVAGYKSWDEAWDSLFERHLWAGPGEAEAGDDPEASDDPEAGDDPEIFRRELATFCAAARATSIAPHDDALARERFMLRTIRRTLEETGTSPEDAMVVCGGFHLFLDRDDPEPPPEPPPGTVYTTVVPYSYPRLSGDPGFRAPRYNHAAWDHARAGRQPEDLLADHVLRVIRRTRRLGEALSSADAIAVTQHTRLLARLRGRGVPVLDDVRDALVTCCVKGSPEDDGHRLLRSMKENEVGDRVGRVTPAVGRLPVVSDFYERAEELELDAYLDRDRSEKLALNKQDDLDARRSAFLHRVKYLAVPFARLLKSPSGRIHAETWRLGWKPDVDAALVEKSLYGDTVETASLALVGEDVARHRSHAGRLCQGLVDAALMDLPDLFRRVEDACSEALDVDGRFVSLTSGLTSLLVLERHAHLRRLRRDGVERLIERCFDRACFALTGAASAPESEEEAVVDGVRCLAEAVLDPRRSGQGSSGPGFDRDLFAEQVRLAAEQSTVAFLRGAFLGVLVEVRVLEAGVLADEITGLARAAPEEMIRAGDFLRGVLTASRASLLLGAERLVEALDELLRSAEWEPFLTMLPRLRAAFDLLAGPQLESLSEQVARRYGLREAADLDLTTSVSAAAEIARIDHRVAEIMEAWEL